MQPSSTVRLHIKLIGFSTAEIVRDATDHTSFSEAKLSIDQYPY
jgi:hypothetical protein